MASQLRVDNILPSVGTNVAIGTAGGSITLTGTVGNLGVGTDNPGAPLDIVTNSSAEGIRVRGRSSDSIGSLYFYNHTSATLYGLVQGRSTDFRLGSESNTPVIFNVNGSEVARFNTSGNLAFPSGQGIDFSATANSSGTMTSELLSDYEEGTFTPQFLGGISNPVYTASTAYGHYTKIGNTVHCWGLIVVSAVTSNGSGNWWLDGFPFAPATGMTYAQVGLIGYNDVQTSEVNKFYMISGATYAVIMPNGVTQSNETYNSNAITTGYFGFTVTYKT